MRMRVSHRVAPGWWVGMAFGGFGSLQRSVVPRKTRPQQAQPSILGSVLGLGLLALFLTAIIAVYWLPLLIAAVSFVALRTIYLLATDPSTHWWRKGGPIVVKMRQSRHISVHSALYEGAKPV